MNFAPVVKFGSKMLFKLRKSAPAIMTGASIILGGACVVTACVQTTKLPETIRENKERIEELHNAPESSQEPRRASELRKEYISMAGKAARLYAVPATLGALSVACTIGGHKVLTKENAALASAYIALDKSFRAYKEKMPLPTTLQETVEEEIENRKVNGSKDGTVSRNHRSSPPRNCRTRQFHTSFRTDDNPNSSSFPCPEKPQDSEPRLLQAETESDSTARNIFLCQPSFRTASHRSVFE